ncbi:SDR family oxidoreductase, partial [Rubrivirga sp.]|uniref:SDR family oxidoreductase n=1 Tax=Rubrivirga sp. TaxID=1885344 RepID=UPI003C77506F
MRVVVTGATGTVGTAVLNKLLADGHEAVAADRSGGRDWKGASVRFDFEDVSTHRPALEGADGLFLMRPPSLGADAVNPVVDAALGAGVGRVAFLSVLGAGRNPLLPHRAT